MSHREAIPDGIAIVGMAGRFPGASTVAEFWRNQCDGVESISFFSEEQVRPANGPSATKFVGARSVLKDVDRFDASFFGINPKEAELIDPQHRVFLECCWEAIENAGYDPKACPELTGVFAGCAPSTYFLRHVCSDRQFIDDFTVGYQVANYPALLGSNVDFLATRVSYKLNLRGPAYTLQTGCSTSLVAVCQAARALQTFECDMALAGGVSITFPQERGYPYLEGGMVSPDGHVRAFDANAQGTVFGSGAGVVLLKRLEDATRDGDTILAIIRGFAVNNDGSGKVGYTAPSVEGQARVIAMAQEAADIDPETIGYIEAHGTGTPLGDPIEIKALTKAFRRRSRSSSAPKRFCAVGTAKTNVGHLDIAAGVTGLIHAVQVVREGVLPPTLHFQKPNAELDLEDSPFYVNTKYSKWPDTGVPRRAGVSAFGIGGTNAHVILEQAEPVWIPSPSALPQLLTISARSQKALNQAAAALASDLSSQEQNLADIAWTLQTGRHPFEYRCSVVASTVGEAANKLSAAATVVRKRRDKPEVAFLFPGQGSQHANMAREIYGSEKIFQTAVDQCCEILAPHLQLDLKQLLYPAGDFPDAQKRITDTSLAQPAIFTVSYALAQLWLSWGISPSAMIGHSVGEFVGACLARVFSIEDALTLIATRGRMMQGVPSGSMLSVAMDEAELRGRINGACAIAAVNAPSLCVVAGPPDRIARIEEKLSAEGIACRALVTSHAFHSPMMDPLVKPFHDLVAKVKLREPRIPYVSCVTGDWIKPSEATDPGYWSTHLRSCVQFAAGIRQLMGDQNRILLEVGPGDVLCSLARRNNPERFSVSSLPSANQQTSDAAQLKIALGSLWEAGVQPDWKNVHAGEHRKRVSLPTYPFERERYWIDRASSSQVNERPLSSAFEAAANQMQKSSQDTEPMTPAQATAPASNGLSYIRAGLAAMFQELSGVDVTEFDDHATFLEMGFDSLFLTQVTQALQKKFGVKITFGQLMGDLATLGALATHLAPRVSTKPPSTKVDIPEPARTAPQLRFAPHPGAALSSLSEGQTMAPDSTIERLMREQILAMNQLFAKQLEAIRTSSVSAMPAPESAATPSLAAVNAPASSLDAGIPAKPEPVQSGSFSPRSFGPSLAMRTTSSLELTEKQKQGLERLISDATKRTAKSKSVTEQYRQFLADPRVAAGFHPEWKEIIYPLVTQRSRGSRLWDVDGNEYIDLLNGFGPILLGHRPDFVEKAIEQQLHEGFEIGPQSPLAGEIAQKFCEITGNERMTFCNTGSEAVVAALRVARTVTGRNKVVAFSGSYHGMFDEVLAKGIRSKNGTPHVIPAAAGIPQEKIANLIVLDYGTRESLDWIRQHASELAAVLVEPVQSRHPNLQPVEFLREVRAITQQSETALIFDEVVTGFRVHPGGCQALFGIRADLATYGKVLAGGMPVGALAGKARFMDALDGGSWRFGDESYPEAGVTFFAGTFVRHPLALAAIKAVLNHLEQQGPQLQETLTARTRQLVNKLNDVLSANDLPYRIETFASWFYLSFPAEERFSSLLYHMLRVRGIHLLEGFPCFLTTAHSDADLDRVVTALRESVEEMCRWQFFIQARKHTKTNGLPEPASELAPAKPRVSEAPTTEAELEIWLSDQLGDESSCSFIESFSLHLRGYLNERALKKAVSQIVDRHDALRATFGAEGALQTFAPVIQLEIPTLDLTNLPQDERSHRLAQAISDDARKPFRLAEGPLVRAQLLRLETNYSVLVFTAHHVVCDGWSANILLDELSKLYNANLSGKPADLPQASSFAEYAKAQQDFLRSAEGKETQEYWLKQFEQLPPRLDLPIDRPRPSVREFAGATYRHQLSTAVCDKIRKLGARNKCTLFVTLFSGFQVLLSRLSGQDDIVIGVPAAGQSTLEDSSLVGHCVNFLPLRMTISRDSSVSLLLSQTKGTVLAAYDHQQYTYGRLVRELTVQRDPSRLPLTEVQFNLERVGGELSFEGLKAEADPNPKNFVNFDIFLNVVESNRGLTIDCDYNTGLFNEATVARLLERYESLLEGMADRDDRPVFGLPFLTESETRALAEMNATKADYPQVGVHQLFENQVLRRPDSVAVIFGGKRFTYKELDRRANQIARHLSDVGITRGNLVGILVERSFDMVAALLGVLKTGAAYVPMDPTYPAERISFVLSDASVSVLLTQQTLAHAQVTPATKIVYLDSIGDEGKTEGLRPAGEVSLEDLAYVIYTSGSTGRPKGVAISHRSAVNLLHSMSKNPGFTEDDILTAVTTLSFDIAALELFLPLSVGAKLVIASHEAVDGARLLALLQSTNTTVMQATPVTWKLLLDAGWNGSPRIKVLCGGEVFPRDLANALIKLASSVWNMYGPTETTIWSAVSRVSEGAGPVPIGPPIDNTQFYVLDGNNQIAPQGVIGELHIGGDGLAREYFRRPELTAEKFIRPAGSGPPPRLYKTGDLVRWRADGGIEFLGRADHQVKLRGFRIELGEIETVISRYPGVKEAIVAVREDVRGEKILVAYLASDQQAISVNAIREFLSDKLPNYMHPVAVVCMNALPLTPNGKIDRSLKNLPLPDKGRVTTEREFTPPNTQNEKLLAGIWSEVLRLDRVGINDNLFDLGADSLHIFQIAARAAKAGLVVAPAQFLKYRTIASVLEQLGNSEAACASNGRAPTIAKIVPVSRDKYRVSRPS